MSATLISVAPRITWKLVTICPSISLHGGSFKSSDCLFFDCQRLVNMQDMHRILSSSALGPKCYTFAEVSLK